MSLGPALEAMLPAFKAENRNKMSRAVLAKHLGYTSLNGRALGKIGAVRAYGLIDGSGDELRISDDAVTALNAPAGSQDRTEALSRLASRPSLFQELRKDFPDSLPSLDNLKYSLVKRQFTPDAAEKAAKSYLATMNLVAGIADSYTVPDEAGDENGDGTGRQKFPWELNPPPPPPPPPPVKVKIMDGERELTTGLLSKDANFRLVVSGPIGVKEIERLIQKLELDKEILADQGADESAAEPDASNPKKKTNWL
jgi:hypothetical protein